MRQVSSDRPAFSWTKLILNKAPKVQFHMHIFVAFVNLSLLAALTAMPAAAKQHAVSVQPSKVPDAYPGVPYDVKIKLNCDPNCTAYTVQPNKLSDGTVINQTTGELKFTSSSKLAGTQILTLIAKDASGTAYAAVLKINVDQNSFTANPHGTPPTGTQANEVSLPAVELGTSYNTSVSLSVQCTSAITLASVAGAVALPAGLVATNAAGPNLMVNAQAAGLAAGTYQFSASCNDAGGLTTAFFSVQVLGAAQTVDATTTATSNYDDLCQYRFNDCDWKYVVTGGAEESALSAQDSETNAFVSLFVRGPWNLRSGSAWSLVRFLGAANANNTNNVVSAYTTATGSTSSSGLPQVGTALDYAIGYEYDWFHPNAFNPTSGQFTIGAVVAFGATTPLSAQHATTAYVVPAWGTNECNELLSRFPSSAGSSGLPAQPSSPYITTTVTPTSGTATTTTAGPYCVINNQPTTTTSSTGTTVVSGTAQTDIAFAPEDRNSFLLKYVAGLRLITRENAPNTLTCGTSSDPNVGVCSRGIVDLTVGQDEAITGGMLRHFVGKADVDFPIPGTSVHFFGSAAMRFTRNQDFSPLILQPATIVASSPTPPTTITVPSTTTWVLPLTQPNRDFYRIGIGLDLGSTLGKIFKAPSQ